MRTSGIFTCSVTSSVTCFISVPRVTGSVGSGLLRLVVPSLTLTACFLQVWGRFIPVEIKNKE